MDRAREQLLLATSLCHSVPGVALAVTTRDGDRMVVGRHRRDAVLDPCALRRAVMEHRRGVGPRVLDTIAHVEVISGLIDIGGGLYQSSHPSVGDERWFATLLGPDQIRAIVAECPLDIPDDAVDVAVTHDAGLATSTVRVTEPHPATVRWIDEAAYWLLSACLVGELIGAADWARWTRDGLGGPG
jgi:hypothetical protein